MPKVKLFDEKLVLKKAMELFWKKGYNATSIQDLVDYLGINRSSIYDTYGGKKELFNKAFKLYRDTNITAISEFLNSQQNVKQGLQNLFETAIKQSDADTDNKGCFVVNTITELIPGDEIIKNVLIENKKTFVKIFYDFLLKGEKNGEIPKGKDLKSIANLFFILYNGIKVVSKVQTDSAEMIKSINITLKLLD